MTKQKMYNAIMDHVRKDYRDNEKSIGLLDRLFSHIILEKPIPDDEKKRWMEIRRLGYSDKNTAQLLLYEGEELDGITLALMTLHYKGYLEVGVEK